MRWPQGLRMKLKDIEKCIQHQESRSIEYKQSVAELDKLGKAICGFLNAKGGIGFIGITDKRKILGTEVTESTKDKLSAFCNHFDPWPDLDIAYVSLKDSNKQVIVITATPKHDATPFTYHGVPYIRNEAQSRKMPAEIYKQRLLNVAGFSENWESLSVKSNDSIDKLDKEEILRTMATGQQEKRLPIAESTNDIKDILTHLDLINEDGQLNNAAMVLFAKNMPAHYPQCFLRMGRFLDESMNETLDSQQLRGNAFQLLSEAENFVRRHLPLSSHFSPNKMERIDELALPFLAVREAIINALVHRNYSDKAGDIALFIFNTHLEIHNIGHLYGGLTVAKLKERHTSRRRNPKIAHVFYIRKLIERYGSGTLRMIELCEQQGIKPPEFLEAGDGFLVKFYFKQPIGPIKQVQLLEDQLGFSEREKALLRILSSQQKVTLKEIMTQLQDPPTDRTVRSILSDLRNKGLVNSEGFGRGAVWFLQDNKETNKEIIRK